MNVVKKRSSKRRSRRTDTVKALSEISRTITSDLLIEDILASIVEVTAKLMGSNICSIFLLDSEKNLLVNKASQSVSALYNNKPPLKAGEGIAGKVLLLNKPAAVKDVKKEPEYKYRDIAKKEGLCSLLCVPLAVKGKAIGVINSYTSKPHAFTGTEIEVLSAIASLAAMAIENTGLLMKAKSVEEELQSRKSIERAKGILMRDEGLSEEDAYLRIQRFSMDSRKTMREIADSLILSYNLRRLR